MILETPIVPYLEWLPGALQQYALLAVVLGVLAMLLSYSLMAIRYGPLVGGDIIYRVLVMSGKDLMRFSFRRTWALARLAIQESLRRRVWVVFVVYAVMLLFAGWFLDPNSKDPARLYLGFVLFMTSVLILALALFLSSFSLPDDIKHRTIYTVVTKPVGAGEIVLGRIVGFTLLCTAMLAVMCAVSYLFVVRSLAHTHTIDERDLQPIESASTEGSPGKTGRTSLAQGHRHQVVLDSSGNGETDFASGHRHDVTASTAGGKTHYTVGPPVDELMARVPILGRLQMKDKEGNPGRGISTGQEWGYRRFIEGGTLAAAYWTFEGITPEAFPEDKYPDGIPLEMTVRVYRSYKGDIEKGIQGTIYYRNPVQRNIRSTGTIFTAKDNTIDSRIKIPRKLEMTEANGHTKQIDLFRDVVADGKLEVWIQCVPPTQYFGFAQADVYLKAPDGSFAWNFVKAHLSIWMAMVLVVGFGVMFSTLVSGPVALSAVVTTIVVGFFSSKITDLFLAAVTGNSKIAPGGGPIESLVRNLTQRTITLPFEPSLSVNVMQRVDKALLWIMKLVTDIVPTFGEFDQVQFVSQGFNIPTDIMLMLATKTLGFILLLFLAGFFFLRTREVAR